MRLSTVLGFVALAALAASGGAGAAEYPDRTIRIVVPFAAGGGTDLVMRALAESVASDWKASIIIENKPGAGTTLGATSVLSAPADGYTLFANTASFLITPHLMSKRPYDASADFAPVAEVASSPHVLVVGKHVPAGTLAEFTAWAKGQPAPATFASFGTGSSSHLGFEILRHRLGLAMVHVPYRGAAPALLDVLGGRVDSMLADLSTVAEHVKTGAVRAIGVAGDARSAALPDVPTLREAGLDGYGSASWFGLVVRSGTPPEIVARWNGALRAALEKDDVRARLAVHGIEPSGTSSEVFGTFMRAEEAKYVDAIRQSGAKLE